MAKIIVSDASGEREVPLDKDELGIGRTAQNDIPVKVPEASRNHCRVVREGDAWFVEDLDSSNGTRVNGRKVTKFELQDGDEISIGAATMRFLESDVVAGLDEISLEEPDDDIELEISLDDDAWLRFANGDREGEKVELTGRITIGRKSTNSVSLKEHGVSGTHAEVVSQGGNWVIRDLGSTNGVVVDGEKIDEATLEAGSQVRIGSVHFIAGIGGSEGDGSLVETLIVEETPLDDEVFAISEKNFKRRQKAAFLGWVLVFVAGLAGAAYWLTQTKASSASDKKPIRVAGNLITEGSSFEFDEDLEGYLVSETADLEYEEITRGAHSGAYALQVKSLGGEGRRDLVFEQDLGAIGLSDRLRISGFLKAGGISGPAGLSLLWLDERGRPMRHSRVNAAGEGSGYEEVSGVFRVPGGAKGARLAISVTDASGKVIVDDVAAVRLMREDMTSIRSEGFELVPEPNGRLSLLRDAVAILADIEVRRREGDAWLSGQDHFVCEDLALSEAETKVSGRRDDRAFTLGARTEAGGFACEITAEGATDAERVVLTVAPGEDVVTVGAEGTRRHVDPFSRDGVTALVVGGGVRAVEISLPEPTTVEFARIEGASRLVLPLSGDACRFGLKVDFSDANEAAQAAMKEAERADIVEKKLGQAMGLYQAVVDRFPFRKDLVDRAERRLSELRRQGTDRADELEKKLRDVVFFRSFVYDGASLYAATKTLAISYEGSEIATRAESLSAELTKAMEGSRASDRVAAAENYLARGRDLLEPGQSMPVLARGFFRSVITLAPESEWAEAARGELAKIAKIASLGGSQEGN